MKLLVPAALLLLFSASLAPAKDKKKNDLPPVFSTAHSVYVQSEDGDSMNDREVVANVQDALRSWNRYTVTFSRRDADLIIVVRKGRPVAGQPRGDVGFGDAQQSGGSLPGRNPGGAGSPNPVEPLGGRSEVGAVDDELRVFSQAPDGKLNGPLWSREMRDGLDAPNVMLLRALREAVERAYPPQAGNQPAEPAKQ